MIPDRGLGFYSISLAPALIRPGTSCACLQPTSTEHCAKSEIGRGFRRPMFPPQSTRGGSPPLFSPLQGTAPQGGPARPGSHESRQHELRSETSRRRRLREIPWKSEPLVACRLFSCLWRQNCYESGARKRKPEARRSKLIGELTRILGARVNPRTAPFQG